MGRDAFWGDLIDYVFQLLAFLQLDTKQGTNSINHLLTSTVCDRDRQGHGTISFRGLLGSTDGIDNRLREYIESADRFYPNTSPVDLRILSKLANLPLNCSENSRYLSCRSLSILGRENPNCDGC